MSEKREGNSNDAERLEEEKKAFDEAFAEQFKSESVDFLLQQAARYQAIIDKGEEWNEEFAGSDSLVNRFQLSVEMVKGIQAELEKREKKEGK